MGKTTFKYEGDKIIPEMHSILGYSINGILEDCIVESAYAKGKTVHLDFNGCLLLINTNTKIDDLMDQYYRFMKAAGDAYRNSGQGKQDAAERKVKVRLAQIMCDAFYNQFTANCFTHNCLMIKLKQFTEYADDVDVKINYKGLYKKFKDVGYIESDYVGKPSEINKSSTKMARYVIGQVMACLAKDMPPMPITVKFIEDYEKQYKEENP